MNSERVKQWLSLREAIDAQEADVAAKKTALAELGAELVKDFDMANIQNVNIDGKCVYLSHDLKCNVLASNREAVVAWAKDNGLAESVKEEIPTATIKAYIRECMGEARDLELVPAELASIVKVYEEFSIRVRNS